MFEMFERADLATLSVEQIAPLEALLPFEWPDIWRDLATSQYVTLVSAPGSQAVPAPQLAQLAMALTMGIAQDMGGTQPYIPVGAAMASGAKAQQVLQALQQGRGYREVAAEVGLTESRVRQIESAWRREQFERRQTKLDLD